MSVLSCSPVPKGQEIRVFATLVSAFAEDPVERWLFPESQQYLTQFPAFLAAFGGRAFDHQSVWMAGDFAAVALWLPPGIEPDVAKIIAVLRETVSPQQHEDLFAVLDQMDAGHPKYPHWYLPWLGVEEARQGEGLGSQLLRHCLTFVDASHLPAFLETPNPRNIAFYERHGFQITAVAQAGSCPPITLMLRTAQQP